MTATRPAACLADRGRNGQWTRASAKRRTARP